MTRPARIMIVEDSATQAAQLRLALESQGWQVVAKTTAEDALRQLSGELPDLIVVDFSLPNMTGDEFCRQVRMRIDTRIIPIIMLTSHDSIEMETRGLESGADDFVRKSNDLEHLLLRVRTMLRRVSNSSSVLLPVVFNPDKSFVLAIDDSATYRAFLKQQLRGESYGLETIASAVDGLQRMEAEPPDCVLVDLVMPDMNGLEACRRIDEWRRRRGVRTMILMLTANEDTQGLEQALNAGADDFVGKSSDIVVIKVRIRALLRRKFYEDENQRILEELKSRELEAERARMAQEAAEAKATLTEELQRAVTELLQANAELEEFAYAASHDLRSPLRSISALTGWLKTELSANLSSEQIERFELITGRANRLETMVDDLLAFARAGKLESQIEGVDTGALARETFELVGAPPSFKFEVAADMPIVNSPKPPLMQVFANLIDNAVKHHGGDKGQIRVSSSDEGNLWRFIVADDGQGIPCEFHQRVFDLFQTLKSRDHREGSGLGLAIVKRVVERHGGQIALRSEPGQGADFSFTWPKQAIPRAAAKGATIPEPEMLASGASKSKQESME